MTAPRIEYGARVVSVAHPVYVRDFDRAVVDSWMAEYGAVTPLLLVVRVWDGDVCSGWDVAA